LPACAALFSPWTDLAATGESLRRNGRCDPLFHGRLHRADARHYLGGEDPRNPDVSPLYADLAGLPPLLIQVSRTEVLLDDSLQACANARGCRGVADPVRDLDRSSACLAPAAWPPSEARAAIGEAACFIVDRS
jgi:acetyl esterase/lipase